ncbi:hypothetical protein NBRC103581_00620 [Gluconobacter wancherniae NBRC 103581]|uniref:Uncharacterized protein n=1 Tax=Gluconobacter wancherniae NBRC 103581 TaxID=656744 RepID=A0A511AXW4_9PROT|nr:hypothetical protein NBRC103581_00620 [Gluconobacter wancherniae NBRC 103581]GBR63098.1 hypothetical protein AA103581_0639 [Gluconobacter wancherniae NBRC 103581]GEK93049.1 hypothetical protein GWA01_08190 [Gluconobacter wancherniae NBRC 103581]
MGYCLIDTVTEYENEAAVGRAITTNITPVMKFFSPPNYGSNATLSASNGSQTSISERKIPFMHPIHEFYE